MSTGRAFLSRTSQYPTDSKAEVRRVKKTTDILNWFEFSSIDNYKLLPTDFYLEKRISDFLRMFGITNYFVLTNPFSNSRFSIWALEQKIGQQTTNFFNLKTLENYYVEPENGLVKLDDNVFFLHYCESVYNASQTRNVLIFQDINKWTKDSVIKFLNNFSRQLKDAFDDFHKKDRDLNAFNSLFLPEEMEKEIRNEIELFLDSRELYDKDLNLSWKRGFMLIGPPGNGKTLLIKTISKYYALEMQDIKNAIGNDGNIHFDHIRESSYDMLLYPDNYPTICVLEDIDKFVTFQSGCADHQDVGTVSLHALLKALDGIQPVDGIIIIATTNFPDTISEALVNRPGRFDKIWKINKPREQEIEKMIKHFGLSFTDDSDSKVVSSLKDLSMAFVAEFIKSMKTKYKRNEFIFDEANSVLQSIHDHDKAYKNHFAEEKQAIGFGK